MTAPQPRQIWADRTDPRWHATITDTGGGWVTGARWREGSWQWSKPLCMGAAQFVAAYEYVRDLGDCPTCTGPIRETTDMVCPTCGTNYAPDTNGPRASTQELAEWLVSLDDVDGPGAEARRTVTLTQIINRARAALGQAADAGERTCNVCERPTETIRYRPDAGGHICQDCDPYDAPAAAATTGGEATA